MPHFRIRFTGRTKGAIGIFYPITAYREAADPDAAVLALYDAYEHIHHPEITEVLPPGSKERQS